MNVSIFRSSFVREAGIGLLFTYVLYIRTSIFRNCMMESVGLSPKCKNKQIDEEVI